VDKVNITNKVTAEYNRQSLFDMMLALQMEINRGADGYLFPFLAVTSTYTLSLNDALVFADATSGSFSITLKPARECEQKRVTIKKTTAANTVTIDPNGSETIDGAATYALSAQYASVELVSYNGNWWIV
jgi:hypothetical protein